MLEELGFTVLTAGNGAHALSRARQHPDVILLDVGLPDMTGFEVCRAMKADPNLAGIPVVFASATHMSQDDIEQGERAGGSCFLFQPISAEHLLAVVEGVIAKAAQKRH